MDDLKTMTDRMLRPWPLTVRWAEAVPEHSPKCMADMLTLDAGRLRHHECECRRRIERRKSRRIQQPLLLALTQAKYSKPTSSETGGQGTRVDAPLPGNLATPDELLHRIGVAAKRILADWDIGYFEVDDLANWMNYVELAAEGVDDERLDDAAAVLRGPYASAMVYLGHQERRLRLACDECGGQLDLSGSELLCDGCGGSWSLSDELIREGVRKLAQQHRLTRRRR